MGKGLVVVVKVVVLTNHQITTKRVAPTLKAELGQFPDRFRLIQRQAAAAAAAVVHHRGLERRENLAEGGLEARGR
jgi:hypothetical protein